MIKYYIYKILSLKTFRMLSMFLVMLALSGCENSCSGESENYKGQASCWQAKIVEYVMNIIDNLYAKASDIVSGGSGGAAVICVSFSIWMALKLLKTLPSMKEHNIGEVWTEIGHKLFLCAFCAIAMFSTDNLNEAMGLFVIPIYNTLLDLGSAVLNAGLNNGGSNFNLGDYDSILFEVTSGCSAATLEVENLGDQLTNMAKCMVCAIKDRLNTGVKIGTILMCSGRIGGVFVGLTVLLLFSGAKLFFVVFLIDGLFRLNFAVFLLPIFIMGIPFAYTRKWTKHCLLMFINSAGVMMFLALLISICISAMLTIITNINAEGGFAEENIEGMGPYLLTILLVATLIINIPGIAVALADKFVGGGGGFEFQKKISKFVFTVARRAAASVLSFITDGASKEINEGLEQYEKYRNVKEKIKTTKDAFNEKLNSLAGYNDD